MDGILNSADDIKELLDSWEKEEIKAVTGAIAGVVPHAGWYFSGKIAYRVLRALSGESDSIIIAGGHLREGSRIFAASRGFL